MKITNKANLPDAIVKAMEAQRNDYESTKGDGDISVTSLLAPPQIAQLMAKHGDEVTEDASDRLWSLMGTAMHNILEAAETEALVEERLGVEVDGWLLTGKYDRFHVADRLLQDYKFSSVWEYIYGLKAERIAQLNILRYILIKNGYDVDQIEIVMLFRDWQASKADNDASYPQQQIARIKVNVWPEEKTLTYIKQRVELHKRGRAGERIHCTDDERWVNGQKWAVMKKGRKTALRVCDSENDAHKWMMSKGISDADGVHYIEFRPGKYTRCERYCPVADFCPQYAHDKE